MLLTLLAFVLVLGVLIFVHELGHFLAAKAVGIAVPRFSIGLGPPTPLRFRRGETEYQVAWIPFGGYVKMASREEQELMGALEGGATEEGFPPDRLFESKPLAARILVISAGVIMNALFAWLAYGALLATYGEPRDPTTAIARVEASRLPAGAEALAELPAGSRVLAVDGRPVKTWEELERAIRGGRGALRLDLEGREPLVVPAADRRARRAVAGALVPLWPPEIGLVVPDQPAQRAGLEEGDRILAIDGEPIRSWDQLVAIVERRVGEELKLTVARGDATVELAVTPVEQLVQDPASGDVRRLGRIGIGPRLELVRVPLGPVEALAGGWRRALRDAVLVTQTLKGMVLGRVSPRELGGPILIGQASGQVARQGGGALLAFMAFLSINLAILNLLPIPVLDGGHLLFLLIEGLRGGRPLPLALRQRLLAAGVWILFGIMLFAVVNDVLRVVR